ncbi:cupin domain-containing protein [Brucella tritici]|uniref:Cupin n=1 Tax=Brucella tritici TaxID=94626 RepID=A0A6L3YUM9_9HYPH|nr:cupin domain-containing protein [Brucella tritici]KAB2688457.1 cupin [Brucella tritici]
MRIHDDLSQPVIVHAAKMDWIASPAAGVDRRMLFRIGGEVARATSIVRYAPGSAFPRHTHSGGEEIVVLEGTFQDEHGDYPAGSYFRNPPGTSHVPASREGCTIFVRLWQFREGDRTQIVRQPGEGERGDLRPGVLATTVLFDDDHEKVRLEDWASGSTITVDNPRGLEFLVVAGGMTIGDEMLEPQSWGRLPAGMALTAKVGPDGALIWMKDAALMHPDVCQML